MNWNSRSIFPWVRARRAVHEFDPEPARGVLGVRLADGGGGLELALPIRGEPLGQPPAGERGMHHGEEVDPELPREEPARQDEAAGVVESQDEVEVPEQREADRPQDVDLPERVGGRGDEALDRLDRREAEPV